MPNFAVDHAPGSDATLDALAAEIAAMHVIANALADIPDAEARQRVLSWARGRFTAPPSLTRPVVATRPVDHDPTLSCEGLEEFFERPRSVAERLAVETSDDFRNFAQTATAAESPAMRRPFEVLIRGLNNGLEFLLTKLQTV